VKSFSFFIEAAAETIGTFGRTSLPFKFADLDGTKKYFFKVL